MDPWWRHAVIYQIWPRSFADSDGDGIGDLAGILCHLDYLNDRAGGGLGADGIWLSPIFRSPLVDFGYDIEDYTAIDPTFGTLEHLDQLLEEAHRQGMKLILDWVPNHTSNQHPWFVESRSSRDNPRRDWYRWRDPSPDGGPPNNWLSAFAAVGPAWTLDPMTGQYYHHSYTVSQPDLNWDNPEVQEAMLGVLRFWLDRGVDGFRIDVVHRLGKDPEYGDNPPMAIEVEPTGPGRHDADWSTVHDRLRLIRSVADEYPDRLLVGEVYILDQNRIIQYLAGGDQLDLVHNFVFLGLDWSADAFSHTIGEFEAAAGPTIDPAWCLNNHDHSRIRSRFDDDGRGEGRARAAAMLMLGLRGTVFLYQGEELGLPDTDLPAGIGPDVDGRDPARTPIPWEAPSIAGLGAGFTTGRPWLPIGPEAEEINAHSQTGRPASMLELYRRLIRLRRDSRALREGVYAELACEADVFAYERRSPEERVVVVVNFSTETRAMPSMVSAVGELVLLGSTHLDPDEAVGRLRSLEARWLQVVPQKPTKSLAFDRRMP